MQATAVTTRTATTHEDLGKKARTEQLEEKTVGTTRTYDPTKQEQRVVTQEVKTTVTATSGDQVTVFGFYIFSCSFVDWELSDMVFGLMFLKLLQ